MGAFPDLDSRDLRWKRCQGNKLIDGYLKCGGIAEARVLFDELPQRHVVVWNSMISGLVGNGRQAHGHAVVLGVDVCDVFVAGGLVDMYAKFGLMRGARMVADRVVEKDVVMFTALIVGYSQHGDDGEALGIFQSMLKDGVKANDHTLASVLASCGNMDDLCEGKMIHGLTIKSGFESSVAAQTSVTWTSLISGLVKNGREEIALSKFCQMLTSSVVPNSFTLSAALAACSSLAMLDQGKQMHAIVMKLGLDLQKFVGVALINFYGKCGCVEFARLVYNDLSELDVVPVNTMIHAYAQNGYGHEALELFHVMKDRLEPNDFTLVSVLSACCNAGLIDDGLQIFESFRHNPRLRLTTDHYTCMVDILGRAGRLDEAELITNEVDSPDLVLWRTLLSVCKIHGDVARAEKIMSRVLELLPTDEGMLVLSSNLYESMGNWSEVVEMKTQMRDAGLKKSPGMTWVDLDRKIHTFKAGDWSHPCSQEIKDTLVELIMKVHRSGYVPDKVLYCRTWMRRRKRDHCIIIARR
ncbi:hypothetical protein Dimus_029536 [Dionaea muscipula]